VLVYGPTNSGKTYTMQGPEVRGPYSTSRASLTPRKKPFKVTAANKRPQSALAKEPGSPLLKSSKIRVFLKKKGTDKKVNSR